MPMEVSYRLHVAGPAPLSRASVLPQLPGSSTYEPGVLDQVGEQVQRSPWLVAGGGLAGGVLGGMLAAWRGRGIPGRIGGVLGGVVAGLVGAAGIGAAIRGHRDHVEPESVRTGAVASTKVVAPERVKVMTYNVHGGMGGPGEFGTNDGELDELAEVIRRERPDVLLLQEVDRFATRSDHADVLAELADRLGADSAVSGSAMTTVLGRDQDVAVLTFNGFEVEDARNIVHADPRGGGFPVRTKAWLRDARAAIGHVLGQDWQGGRGYEVRNTIDALVRTPAGNAVRVLSGHYEWPTDEVDHQRRQVADVAGALDAWDGATIWGADFNVQRTSDYGEREQRIMGRAGLRDAFEAADDEHRVPVPQRVTSPEYTVHPGGGIDRIYASDHARVLDARVVRSAGDASDHLPVVAELELRPDGHVEQEE